MGQYRNQGMPALALAEECAEVIQIITKMRRFGGNWDEVPPGQTKSRWEMFQEEMADLMYQYERVCLERKDSHLDWDEMKYNPNDEYESL